MSGTRRVRTLIEASGQYVGLRAGQMGNSEVGHLNIKRRADSAYGHIAHRLRNRDRRVFQERALIKAMDHAKS